MAETIGVARSHLRWCSDGFEFTWLGPATSSGAFIIDGRDRDIMMNSGISGSDIRDIRLEGTRRCCGTYSAPAVVAMLSDNGSPSIAKDTQIFARQLGLKPCFTSVRSPQRNGMSEAFVKTFKRNYVLGTPLPDAQTVLGLAGGWIEDHSEKHPHSGLKIRSPRASIATQTAAA